MTGGPVFVVGPARSGTTLVRNILSGHPNLHVAAETHYFDDLRPQLLGPPQRSLGEADRRACLAYFRALADRQYGHGGQATRSPLDPDELLIQARALGNCADAIFAAHCLLQAQRHGKERWGEKTPRHVFRIGDMLEAFPDAQILCVVRDPRGTVASYRDWSAARLRLAAEPDDDRSALRAEAERIQRSSDVALLALLWRSAVGAALRAHRRFGGERVRLLRYEDLVRAPELTVPAIFRWLALPCSSTAVENVPIANSSYLQSDPRGGFAVDAVDRWRERLTAVEAEAVQHLAGPAARRFAYAPSSPQVARRAVLSVTLRGLPAALRALDANRTRREPAFPYVARRVTTLWR